MLAGMTPDTPARTGPPLWRDPATRHHAGAAPAGPLVGTVTADVVVLGAGITGLTAAVDLARAGRDVIVLEAREVGAGTTGGSSAKATLAQGTRFSSLGAHHPPGVVARYAEANLAGLRRIREVSDAAGLPTLPADGVTYATTSAGRARLTDEAAATTAAGLSPELTDDWPDGGPHLAVPVTAVLRLRDQLAIDPQAHLDALLDEAVRAGVRVHVATRAERLSATGGPREVGTRSPLGRGLVRADRVVVATGTPVFDRAGFFARLEPERSLCVAVRVRGERPTGMYLSVDRPTRSVRRAGEDLLVVGGNGFPVGRVDDVAARFVDLEAWARTHLDVVEVTHRWAAQDYATPDSLPFVGRFHPWSDDVLVATGFAKWGMAAGTAAGMALAAQVLGSPLAWAGDWDPWRGDLGAQTPSTLALNAQVARHLVTGWAGALKDGPPDPAAVPEGRGVVGRDGATPVGVSRVDGQVRTVKAVCPHLGGVLRWNDAEASWDCPLHGSRFTADGARLEGPAACGLARLDQR
jgi:glycine/D-amino acid oxidase-like deaminating enzyme/nitrite reductase/ring-hydroxylating ferredoxin subunit